MKNFLLLMFTWWNGTTWARSRPPTIKAAGEDRTLPRSPTARPKSSDSTFFVTVCCCVPRIVSKRRCWAPGGQGFAGSGDQPVMRGMHFCLVDEADSILIDEARTPLIIGSIEDTVRDQIVETYRWASEHAAEYELDDHFTIDPDTKQYELTARGRQKVRSLPKPDLVRTMGLVDLYEYTERAVKVHREFLLDRQYVVRPRGQRCRRDCDCR